MLIYIIFAVLMLFVFAYYFAFEYCRYKIAKMLADGLGGRAVFRIGGSYMKRDQDGVEERAWVVPDDSMAWGSILSAVKPSSGMLFLQRAKAFRKRRAFLKARLDLKMAQRLQVDHPAILLESGILFREQEQNLEARLAWQRIIELYPDSDYAITARINIDLLKPQL